MENKYQKIHTENTAKLHTRTHTWGQAALLGYMTENQLQNRMLITRVTGEITTTE